MNTKKLAVIFLLGLAGFALFLMVRSRSAAVPMESVGSIETPANPELNSVNNDAPGSAGTSGATANPESSARETEVPAAAASVETAAKAESHMAKPATKVGSTHSLNNSPANVSQGSVKNARTASAATAAPTVRHNSPSSAPRANAPAKAKVFIPTKRTSGARAVKNEGFSIPTKGQQARPIGKYGDAPTVRIKSKDELDRAKPKSYSGNPEDLLLDGEKQLSRPQD